MPALPAAACRILDVGEIVSGKNNSRFFAGAVPPSLKEVKGGRLQLPTFWKSDRNQTRDNILPSNDEPNQSIASAPPLASSTFRSTRLFPSEFEEVVQPTDVESDPELNGLLFGWLEFISITNQHPGSRNKARNSWAKFCAYHFRLIAFSIGRPIRQNLIEILPVPLIFPGASDHAPVFHTSGLAVFLFFRAN